MRLPSLPASFLRADLEAVGFSGWCTWQELRASNYSIPRQPLVYVVYRASATPPLFRSSSPGGRFKGRNPTVPIAALREKWVEGAHTIYIGKANEGRQRIMSYARFGAGEPVGHWGGRYIWQLADSDELLVAWHRIDWEETARRYEIRLLVHFRDLHAGDPPFGNLAS